ncbi:hypothetical protein VCRA2123O444_370010 [Vibrio crassostreae]|nr:hypothetical protein VCRA2114O423_340010 [Vibrio crassostreae]CAK2037100.1 hypothetical protein VCRA2114O421_350010 [Vibrio crassostreae]CAK2041885.1 hypothetical protein VCRA2113O414_340010 [Vibrio crassostreae]CAK2047135.1 hypothetical protein VCRA2114O422_380010 [Vibrio crassostreae]CAK2047397.1 hypothetical protein VCRA2119O430_370010 [Vibrio crassostreae]
MESFFIPFHKIALKFTFLVTDVVTKNISPSIIISILSPL